MTGKSRSPLDILMLVLDEPPDRLDARLAELCGGDPALEARVRELLEHDRDDTGEFATIGLGPGPGSLIETMPERIGPYRLTRLIGEGGMGLVYEAEQDEPRRRVAIKMLRIGASSRAMLRRFRHESEILGRLTHPGIARVYDAGSFTLGGTTCPYFAMEFVDGVDLVEHAARLDLPRSDRIELLLRLCDAVEHAHQRGVIHRDLKPSNVLVDEHGTPRVLDFGVARATDADLRVTTLGTSTGELLGTLAYMSPEQLEGRADRIDTRSDVYAIGAIAYELLSGKPAHDVADRSLPDAILAVREHDVTPIWAHDRTLRTDLGTVIMKALEKEPDRRYAGASSLADDLRRVLRDEPIAARAPTTTYQLRKFATRNRGLVVGLALVFLVLVAGVTATSLGLARAIAAERAANTAATDAAREAAIAQAVNEFLNEDLLSSVDPTRTTDRDVTVREVLDIAADKVGDRFTDQPIVEVSIRGTLANTYERIGQSKEAEPHRRRAAEILNGLIGEADPRTISAVASLATNLMNQSRFGEALDLITRNLELMRGRPELDTEALRSKSNLAAAYLELGRFADAAPILAETLEAKRAELGDRDPSTLTSIHNLAGLYYSLGETERSEALYRAAYEGRSAVLGEADPKTLSTMTAWTWALTDLGRYEQAESLLDRALAIARERLDPGHPAYLQVISSLGNTLSRSGKRARAEEVFSQLVALRTEHLGPDHAATIKAMGNLAEIRFELGRVEEALSLLTDLAERESRALPEGHYLHGMTLMLTGRCHDALGRPDQAEPFMQEGACILVTSLGAEHPRSVSAVEQLLEFYESHQDDSKAAELREAPAESLRSLLCKPD
ncbi:MAG: serine/threonine protein kinase [Phycisphaeraceae bacterium]|nr:MAG: serine/threonine protein kinase [Phycisphaeraceae bacterium]